MQWCPCPWSLHTRSDTCRNSLPLPLTCVHGLQIHHPAPGGAKASAPPGPSLLPQPGPRGSQGLPPPALCRRRSCRHYRSGCHLGRALRCSGPGSTPRTGLAHSPGEHAARGGGLGHAPWQGPRAWPRAHAKQGFAYVELGAGREGCQGAAGAVPTLRNTCLLRPRLTVLPHHALSGSYPWGSLRFGELQASAWLGSRKVSVSAQNLRVLREDSGCCEWSCLPTIYHPCGLVQAVQLSDPILSIYATGPVLITAIYEG